jgi:hypothetical protein
VRQLEVLEEPAGVEPVDGEQEQLLQRGVAAEAAAGDVEVRHGDGLALVVPEAQAVAEVEAAAVLVGPVEVLDRLGLRGPEVPDGHRRAGVRVLHPQRQPAVADLPEGDLVDVPVRAEDRAVPEPDECAGLRAGHAREHRRARCRRAGRAAGDVEGLGAGSRGVGRPVVDQQIHLAQQLREPPRPALVRPPRVARSEPPSRPVPVRESPVPGLRIARFEPVRRPVAVPVRGRGRPVETLEQPPRVVRCAAEQLRPLGRAMGRDDPAQHHHLVGVHRLAACQPGQRRAMGTHEVRGLQRVALGLPERVGGRLLVVEPGLAHHAVHGQPEPRRDLAGLGPRRRRVVARAAHQVLRGQDGLEAAAGS